MLKQFDIIAVGPSLQLGKNGHTLSTDNNGLLINGDYIPSVIDRIPTSSGPYGLLVSELYPDVINRLTQDTVIDSVTYPAGTLLIKSADGLSFTEISASGENWTVKSSAYTCVGSENILLDSTGTSFSIALPASPATNTTIRLVPLFPSYTANPVTILRNGNLINGGANDILLNQNDVSIELYYYGSSIGWVIINRGSTTIINTAGTILPANAAGVLINNGSGSLSWGTVNEFYSASGHLKAITATFTYTSGTFTIDTIPNNSIVTSCSVKVTVPFGGAPTLTVGTDTDTDGISVTTDFDMTIAGLNFNRSLFDVTTDGVIKGYLSGATTSGSALIFIEYYLA